MSILSITHFKYAKFRLSYHDLLKYDIVSILIKKYEIKWTLLLDLVLK
jgi:hypothetical protein